MSRPGCHSVAKLLMADRTNIPLTPASIDQESPEFGAIRGWPFADPFVARLLHNDIPQRVRFGNCRIWIYRDPERRPVGFGTLDVCEDYRDYTGGQAHPYIPLLAVNPTLPSLGYGTTIVQHLIDEATLLACRPGGCHDVLYLDVYTSSEKAIGLYRRFGFAQVTPEPIEDPQEGGKPYVVMAK
jgi:GNAT superfamily N-acetyltransferase